MRKVLTIMKIGKSLLPPLKYPLRKVRDFIVLIPYRGKGRYCPVCNKSSRKFGKYGRVPREDAKCMYCGALERHRLVWLYFKVKTDLFSRDPIKMLHVAPEARFQKLLKQELGAGYITADLHDSQAMVQMDITDIGYPDELFDVIYCSHVLEHCQDDKKGNYPLNYPNPSLFPGPLDDPL